MSDRSDSLGAANFADPTGVTNMDSVRARLSGGRGPSTQASTVDFKSSGDWLFAHGRTPDATRVSMRNLDQMRRDPMIAFALVFIKSFLARAPWYIKSADPQRAAFIDGALRRIYGRFILQYTGSLDYGFAPLVKNFERAPVDWEFHLTPDQKPQPVWTATALPVIWTPFTALNPHRARPHFAKDGTFNGIDYGNSTGNFPWEAEGNKPSIPLPWALWATNEKDSVFGSLFGYPRTGYAYRYWFAYWYRFGLADRAFEKWADPPVIAYHPSDVVLDPTTGAQRNYTGEALGLAERLRSGANVSLPNGAVMSADMERMTNLRTWELVQMKSEVDFTALNDAFEYLDVAKLRSMMIPEQAFLEGKGGTSSRNVASTLGEAFEESQAVLKAEIDDHINRYMIPQLLEANFGQGGPSCEIVTKGFDSQDIETARAIVQAFAQNAPGRLGAIDFKELLVQLGIPQLNFEQTKEQEAKIVEETAKAKPPVVQPGGGNAGVNADGEYVGDNPERERIVLAEAEEKFDEERKGMLGIIERLSDRLFGRYERETDLAESAPDEEKVREEAEEKALGLIDRILSKFPWITKPQEVELNVNVGVKDEDDDGQTAEN